MRVVGLYSAIVVGLASVTQGSILSDSLKSVFDEESLGDATTSDELAEARTALAEGAVSRAIELAKKASVRSPDLISGDVFVCRLLFQRGRIELGKSVLERAAIDRPEDPDVFWTFGDFALAQQRLTDAWVHYQHALSLLEGSRFSEKGRAVRRAQILRGCAAVAEMRSDWQSLAAITTEWLKLRPKDRSALWGAARAAFEIGDEEAATDLLERLRKIDTTLDPTPLIFFRWASSRRSSKEAAPYLEQAQREYSDHPAVMLAVAEKECAAGKRKSAIDLLTDLLAQHPENQDALLLRGRLRLASGDPKSAEADFRQALLSSSADDWTRALLAVALAGRYDASARDDAVRIVMQLVRSHPEDWWSWSALGRVKFSLGRYLEAEEALRRALATGAADSTTAYFLAKTLEQRDVSRFHDDISRLLKIAVQAPGLFPEREEARRMLEIYGSSKAAPSESTSKGR